MVEVKELISKGTVSSALGLTLTSATHWSRGQNADHHLLETNKYKGSREVQGVGPACQFSQRSKSPLTIPTLQMSKLRLRGFKSDPPKVIHPGSGELDPGVCWS